MRIDPRQTAAFGLIAAGTVLGGANAALNLMGAETKHENAALVVALGSAMAGISVLASSRLPISSIVGDGVSLLGAALIGATKFDDFRDDVSRLGRRLAESE